MSILDLIQQQLGGDAMKQIGSRLGTDEKTAGTATSAALGTLIGALSRNAAKPEGAQSLANALSKDHDGSVLDNFRGLIDAPETGPGDGILKQVLGNRRGNVEAGLSKATGVGQDGMSKLMTMLAPVVMGALGKSQRQANLDPQGLAGLLGQETQQIQSKSRARWACWGVCSMPTATATSTWET